MDITPEIFDPGVFTRAVEDGDLTTFLDLLSDVEGPEEGPREGPEELQGPGDRGSLLVLNDSVFGEGMPLLHFLCSKKDINEQFIKALLHKGIDVNLSCPKHRRPIHVSCSENCPENLKVLLDYGAKILEAGEQAWQENSPFYVSSLCGHVDIIRTLLSYQPKLIRDQDVRSCLLYAACAGGNRDIVGMWYCPGMDINQPKPYIQSLDNSGDNTPIFAACAGGHYEVVKLLVDMGARLTHRVCTDFPDLTGRILLQYVQQMTPEDVVDRDITESQHTADYSKIQLTTLHGNWLRAYTETLVTLNISENSIDELPEEIPWSFPNLQRFNASHNSLLRLRCGEVPPVCQRLNWIQLSHNKLETLCTELFQLGGLEELYLSYNKLQYLIREHQVIYSRPPNSEDGAPHAGPGSKDWSCDKLTRLDVSHNELKMLPSTIKQCSGLVTLDASHNCMTAFCGGWDCSMANLNLSFNDLERFPEDVEMFWCGSLHYLNLDNNQLEVLADSIVKLCTLTDLIVSNNHLTMLPKPEVWDCPQLYLLNLHGNLLGQPQGVSHTGTGTGFKQMLMKSTSVNASKIVLPKFLAHCLHDLNLRDNQLDCVPEGICHLSSLTTLNLSKNLAIKTLPEEMGKLTSLTALHLSETSVKQTSGQAEDFYQWTKDTIIGLQHKLRKSKPYNKIKLVILGKKDKGKTTLAGLLHGNKTALFHGAGIHKSDMKLNASGNQWFKRANSDISFSVWDMACSDQYIPSQQCFFTRNSLYLLVWDIWSLKNELDKLGHWLYNIEARTPNSRVILVATFLDKNNHLTTVERDDKVSDILKLVIDRYGPSSSSSHLCSQLDLNNIIPVSCVTKEGIPKLKQKLFEIASNMYEPAKGLGIDRLFNRKVPLSFISVEKAVEQKLALMVSNGDPPFIEEEEFQVLIRSIPNNDITTEEDVNAVTQFLVETGSLLHYHDQLRGLNTMYILDPSWLCDLLAKVLIDEDESGVEGQLGRDGKISIVDVMDRYRNDPRFPDKYIGQYLQLLERFEIALSVDNGKKLFIPGRLSQSPALQFHSQEFSGTNVYRLYQMAFIPTGFWSRLLSRIMARLQLLEQPDWKFQSSISVANQTSTRTVCQSRLQHTVIGRQFSGHLGGLHIKKKDMIYWQDGMCMRHTTGYFKLETIRLPQGREKPSKMGILVVVHSTEDEFSIMGTIVDEIDDLLTDHYPGLLEWDDCGEPRVQRYALCPRCYDISSSSLSSAIDHFTVEHCSRVVLTEDTIQCKTGALIPLEQLVPELLIKEIPQSYHMDQTQLEVQQDMILGRGVSGSVYKGKYGNVDVAVKFYHGMPNCLSSSGPDSMDSGQDSWNRNLKKTSPYTCSSDYQDEANPYGNFKELSQDRVLDNDEANSLKAWRSFMEMRQEVAVTSKLHHPCVISFIGICIKPKLLMCLEFAALGNLRNVLDSAKANRKAFNKHRDRDKLFKMILSKDLTFKMIFQIASGLGYLHKHGIIYRDLKSDNILVTTLDLAAPVNVKLSDYGISKFYSTGGTLGLVGTPGYQAPEIMDAQFYDEKVDIFSFAMVIYEVMSGERPYGELRNIGQITTAIKQEGKRPNLESYNFDTRFPQLEQLMENCWKDKGTDRPSALDIVAESLRHVHFMCKHKQFNTRHGEIDLLAPVTDGEKNLVWLWEGTDTERTYTIVDLTSCSYHDKKPLAGPVVTCMCKVDQEVWLGTDVGSDEGKIEVWKQLTSGQLHRQATFSCDGIPTNILYLKGKSKMEKKLYVTLHNGKLRTYTTTLPSNRKSLRTEVSESGWACERPSQQLSMHEASCAIHLESNKGEELWVGCGPDIVVYNVSTSLVENRIRVAKLVYACIPEYGEVLNVQTLVQGDGQVWCLMRDTACVVELDTDMGIATHIYDCDIHRPHNMNMVTEISMNIIQKIEEDGNAEDIENSDKIGGASEVERETSAPPVPPRGSIFSDMPPQRPPRPARQRLTSEPSLSERVSQPDKKVATLPTSSRRHSFSKVVINSVGVVRDTIWVSRNRGDILFICTSNYKLFKKGEVIAVLNCKDEHCKDVGRLETVPNTQTDHCVVESLLCVNDVVVTVIRDDLTCSHLVVWEAYSCKQIDNIRSYWEVRREESKGKAPVRFKRQKNTLQIPSFISEDSSETSRTIP